MDLITDNDVDLEIQRIKGSLDTNVKVKKTNVKNVNVINSLKQLAQELDYLGVSSLMEVLETSSSGKHIIVSLIYATKDLMHLHKQLLTEKQEQSEEYVQLLKERGNLGKLLENQKNEILQYKKLLEINKAQLNRANFEMTGLQRKLDSLKEENQLRKKQNASIDIRYKHKVIKAAVDNQHLQSSLRRNCDKYISQDGATVRLLEEYRTKEETYKEMVEKLHANNEALLEEILNLKEDVMLMAYKKHS